MNKILTITAILTAAIFATSVLAVDNTGYEQVMCALQSDCYTGYTCVNNACTVIMCGVDAVSSYGNGWITFPSMLPGTAWTHSADTTLVTNTGNAIESPTISGGYWMGSLYDGDGHSNYYMPVESTAWTTTDWNGAALLHSTTAPIATLSSLGTTTVYYELSIPSGTPADTYTQIITFGTGC